MSTNCLSVFDHFVKLALKGLIKVMLFRTSVFHDKFAVGMRVVSSATMQIKTRTYSSGKPMVRASSYLYYGLSMCYLILSAHRSNSECSRRKVLKYFLDVLLNYGIVLSHYLLGNILGGWGLGDWRFVKFKERVISYQTLASWNVNLINEADWKVYFITFQILSSCC